MLEVAGGILIAILVLVVLWFGYVLLRRQPWHH